MDIQSQAYNLNLCLKIMIPYSNFFPSVVIQSDQIDLGFPNRNGGTLSFTD